MTEPQQTPPSDASPSYPEVTVVRANRTRLSLAWIVPIAALVVGAVLIARTVMQAGPEITITFRSAEGLEAGRTEIRFKEVVVGKVAKVALSPDRERVLVSVKLDKSAANLAVDDTRFWVVRPRVGLAGVSGLGTLFSGSYIGVDAGVAEEERAHFTGLEAPPLVLRGEPGRSLVLAAQNLGSLDVGSPVYYRRTRVGRVVGYTLDAARDSLDVQLLIEPPNERLVTAESRFWNASGIDLSLSASGLTLDTESRRLDPGRRRGVRQPCRCRIGTPRGRRTALPALRQSQGCAGTARRHAIARPYGVRADPARPRGRCTGGHARG